MITVLSLAAGMGSATADTNPASIAVPLLGTQGAAAPYPSRLTIAARGGTNEIGQIIVRLHAVTHPCPEELAVLLVRNDTSKFLLMSNAGGCRPLQGTDINFVAGTAPIPDAQPASPAYLAGFNTDAANYGAAPVFPAPAPAGPYTPTLPQAFTNINGTWDLYVMDTAAGNRGVIAGGWSIGYDTDMEILSSQSFVTVPGGGGTGPGVPNVYPITFDTSTVPEGVTAQRVTIDLTLRHTRPDDLHLVLQSPSGTAVVLMANAGGSNDLALNSTLTFIDSGPALPDAAQIVSGGNYRPTAYNPVNLPPPAPPGPYQTTMAAFIGDQVRGTWRLYAYDDLVGDTGEITGGALQIATEAFPSPALSMALPSPSNQPFVRLRGTIGAGPGLISPIQGGWRVQNGTNFFDAGPLLFTPGTNIFTADLPLKQGNNNVQYRVQNVRGNTSTNGTTLIVNEFTYSFAEGATGSFFDLDLTVANPTSSDAPVTFDFLPEGGGPVTVPNAVTANAPLQVSVDGIVPEAALSTVVHSTSAVPLAAERTMIWDASGYGGHGGTAVAPSTRWLFAEGSQGFFNTFVLLANDNASAVDVTINFLLEGGGVVTALVNVPAKARHTLFAGDVAALVNTSFGIDITATQPIIAERAMYLPGARLFEGGHESAGVNDTHRQWFLAEGATGSFFDCFVLISNPNPTAANVTLTYLLPSGTTIVRAIVVPANSRSTINVEIEDPQLANADVSTTVVSDIGIVVERAMYWPDLASGWREAHNSFGVTTSALRWGLADGRIGGTRAFQTFVLLANPNPYPAEVEVRFLKAGLSVSRNYVLNPSSRHSIYVNVDVPELGEGVFGADVRVLNYQPIAVEKALYWNSGNEAFAGGTNVTATRLPPP